MDKKTIHGLFVQQLKQTLRSLTDAAKNTAALATDPEHIARSKYETFSLETSYLARGQAARVEELSEAIRQLTTLDLSPIPEGEGAHLGALVVYESSAGALEAVLLSSSGGGEELKFEGTLIQLVQIRSPLGQALKGKKAGETFVMGGTSKRIKGVS